MVFELDHKLAVLCLRVNISAKLITGNLPSFKMGLDSSILVAMVLSRCITLVLLDLMLKRRLPGRCRKTWWAGRFSLSSLPLAFVRSIHYWSYVPVTLRIY